MNANENTTAAALPTRFVTVPEGRVAYDDTEGPGPLIIMVPGIGDLRGQYRHVVGPLAAAGYRVVTMDLRGLGDSDTTFSRYDGEAVAQDILALIRHLDAGPAIVLGNSIAGGSAVFAAAEAPELISRIVPIGGFTRGPNMSWPIRVLFRMLMGGPWRNAVWMAMHDRLFPLAKPADHDAHRARMRANLAEPGRSAALGQMANVSHAYAEARYADVVVPSLFIMGTADSDFPDPKAEATEVAEALRGEAAFIEGAGHYPHVEAPEQFVRIVLDFLASEERRTA